MMKVKNKKSKSKRKDKEDGFLQMKISNKLPQFNRHSALIIVAGKMGAAMYEVTRGILKRILVFRGDKPEFSDKENKPRNEVVTNGFIKGLKEKMKEVNATFSFSRVFILAPSQTKNKITESLPREWQARSRVVGEGNYFNFHPFYVLEKIKDHEHIQ